MVIGQGDSVSIEKTMTGKKGKVYLAPKGDIERKLLINKRIP